MMRRSAIMLLVLIFLSGCTTFGQGTIDVGPIQWTWGPMNTTPSASVRTETPEAGITVLPYGGIETMTKAAVMMPTQTRSGSAALVLADTTSTPTTGSYPAPSTATVMATSVGYPAPQTSTSTARPMNTATAVPSTATMMPPTATVVPSTDTPVPPTSTTIPAVNTAAPTSTAVVQANVFPLETRCPTATGEGLVKQTIQNPYSHPVTWQGELFADGAKVAGAPNGSLPVNGFQYGNLEWGVPVGFTSAHVTGWMKMYDGATQIAGVNIDFSFDCTK